MLVGQWEPHLEDVTMPAGSSSCSAAFPSGTVQGSGAPIHICLRRRPIGRQGRSRLMRFPLLRHGVLPKVNRIAAMRVRIRIHRAARQLRRRLKRDRLRIRAVAAATRGGPCRPPHAGDRKFPYFRL